MRKPLDPSHHSKKPERIHSKEGRIVLRYDEVDDKEVSLETVVGAWNKALKDHESQGHRIVRGPMVECHGYYKGQIELVYTYEWDNLKYEEEKTNWDAELAKYQIDLAAWKVFEAEQRELLSSPKKPRTLDDQIIRAEHRLANLKAVKAGEPLPFPEG